VAGQCSVADTDDPVIALGLRYGAAATSENRAAAKIPNVNRKLTLVRRREPAGCLEPIRDMRDNSVDPAVRDVYDQFGKD